MYKKYTVPVPDSPGRITRKKSSDRGVYFYYEYGRTYYKDRKYTIPRRACIGKEDPRDRSRMYPNERYFEYFPAESAATSPEFSSSRSSCLRSGTYVVIGKLIGAYRIRQWLASRFGERDGRLILDLAAYLLVSERNAAQHYPDYAYNHPLFTPGMRIYSDTTIGTLLKDTITTDDVVAFTEWWNSDKDHRRKIYISYDSTNKPCRAGDIDMIEGGHSKSGNDGDPVFNLSIALDVGRRLPLFYEDCPGSIVDVSQLVSMADKAGALGYRNLGFILDRGYFSRENIAFLDDCGYSFIIMAKGRRKLVSSIVLSVRGSFENKRANAIREYSVSGTTVEGKLYEGDGRTRFFHIYHSIENYAKERAELESMLHRLSCALDRLIEKDCSAMDMDRFEAFYDLEFRMDGKKRFLILYREKEQTIESMTNLLGYFCIISSDRMTARDALLLYKSRDQSEKLFAADKTFAGSRAERVQTESSLRSKLFVEFIALIIRSRFHACICDHVRAAGIRRNYMNVVSVIAELEKIELIRIGNGVYRMDHAITARQREILAVFGMSDEDMKRECSTVSQELLAIDSKDIGKVGPGNDTRDDSTLEDEEETEWRD